MPAGDKNLGNTKGRKTQICGENAVEFAKRSAEVRRANAPIKRALKGIATEALYGKPLMDKEKLKPIQRFYKLKSVNDVTFAHLAMFALAKSAAQGVGSDLNTIAAYAGEKPTENINLNIPDPAVLDELRERMMICAAADPDADAVEEHQSGGPDVHDQ